MDKQEFLNTKYMKLCQLLGDSEIKRDKLEAFISNLKSQIKTLDESFNIISEYEALKSKEQSNE